jgi:hypothetical protein
MTQCDVEWRRHEAVVYRESRSRSYMPQAPPPARATGDGLCIFPFLPTPQKVIAYGMYRGAAAGLTPSGGRRPPPLYWTTGEARRAFF